MFKIFQPVVAYKPLLIKHKKCTHFTRASKIVSKHNISMVNPLKQPGPN